MRRVLVLVALVAALLLVDRPAPAYVEAPLSLGAVVQQSVVVCSMVVTKVDKQANLIVYQKVADLKGKHPQDVIKHNIGKNGLRAGEWEEIMRWAEVGKPAVFFHNGSASETYIGPTWYQAYPQGEWWGMSHGEPFLLRSYAGKVDKLSSIVVDIVAGKEVVVPCMVDGDKETLHKKTAKMQKMKVSLKLQEYNAKRDFAGWGGAEEIRRLGGMPAFDRLASLGRIDPDGLSATPIDFDLDGKPDLCLCGSGKVSLLHNGGDGFTEVALPNLSTGARAATWADYNGDGLPDLFLATPKGPKLYTNLGKAQFRDDTRLLPQEAAYHLTAAAWADFDGDGKPDLLVANGYHGLRLYRNKRPDGALATLAPPKLGPWHAIGPFRDTTGKGNFEFAFSPEKDADLKTKHKGKRDAPLAWAKKEYADGGVQDLKPYGDNCATYLQREIEVTSATELPVSLGSDDTLTVWLNGEKLFAENVNRACAPDQARLTLKLKPGKNRLMLKVCNFDQAYAFYFAAGEPQPVGGAAWFEDVTDSWGLGDAGPLAGLKVDTLAVADFHGDGKPGVLLSNGMLLKNVGGKLVPQENTGLAWQPGKYGPSVCDFDGDGKPDLFVPQQAGPGKLFKNLGNGRFEDVTARSGDLAKLTTHATGAAWGDFDNDGRPDLVVTALRGPNRYFRNNGDGTFSDQTEAVGLGQRHFNTQAAAFVDLNGDGRLDLVLANEGQESVALLGTPLAESPRTPLTVTRPGCGPVTVTAADGKAVACGPVGGDGRGGHAGLVPRFTLPPGAYTVTAAGADGKPLTQAVTVGKAAVAVRLK